MLFTLSRKYSTPTLLRPAVELKVARTATCCDARIMAAPLLSCVRLCATTTGFGTAWVTDCAAPGVGPESGEASQFAGSLEPAETLTRCSDLPLYW